MIFQFVPVFNALNINFFNPNFNASTNTPGGNLFKYQRQPVPGQQVCLELRLSNNLSTAGAETICVTL